MWLKSWVSPLWTFSGTHQLSLTGLMDPMPLHPLSSVISAGLSSICVLVSPTCPSAISIVNIIRLLTVNRRLPYVWLQVLVSFLNFLKTFWSCMTLLCSSKLSAGVLLPLFVKAPIYYFGSGTFWLWLQHYYVHDRDGLWRAGSLIDMSGLSNDHIGGFFS